ncbi:MAG TPA: DUF1080 domain-containing protein, partial [Longimicrobiaceae bacterium]|nr:DUF1080 domain-containing protein [Longimicrobiaceae bacterium]
MTQGCIPRRSGWSLPVVSAATAAFLLIAASACSTEGTSGSPANSPDSREWIEMFNGQDLTGWTVKVSRHDVGVNFGDNFRVADGMIQVRYDQYGDYNDQFAHLYYDQPFSHYLVAVDYRFTGEVQPGAPEYVLLNSGIMLHSQDPRTMLRDQDWPISIEMQFYAEVSPDQPRATGNLCTPGTNVVFEGQLDTRHCIDASGRALPKDTWVTAEALVLGDSIVKHIVNGDTVLVYEKPQIGGGMVTGFDPAVKQDGRLLSDGFIALQSEGQPIDFRNVRLLDL